MVMSRCNTWDFQTIGRKKKCGKSKKMTKKVFYIGKSCTFATSLREKLSLMQHVDNKPFRRAFGSILEGRFPFYMVRYNGFSLQNSML